MKNRIFVSIFLTSFLAALAGIVLTAVISKDSGNIPILVIIAAAIIILSLISAFFSARYIVAPLKKIDLDRPGTRKSYKELSPILERLKKQNGRVNRYITELSGSREQFSLITESMKEGIIIADPKTTVLSCNSGAYRLLGAEPLCAGQSIYSLTNAEPFRRCIQDAMGGRSSECILKTELGDRKIIASPAAVSDILNGIVVFIMDVTEQQALEQMRREFTSNVSHELKTPLTTIYGISDMLVNGLVRPEDVSGFGENIRSEADRLITLIDDIVSLSKLDENALPKQDEEIDIYDLADEVMERLGNTASEKNISYSLNGEHVSITGNRTILDEVIYNLCDNAIKYNKPGGNYAVRISHIPTKVVITVTDTGTGIADEDIERIFERFYRADKSRSGKVKGTGLGLSIVKHGVNYHDGTVKAFSSEEGAVFIVELPIKKY